jgi:hypothetical protein
MTTTTNNNQTGETTMKVTNETLVENILGWAASPSTFRHGGYQWAAEVDAEQSDEDCTVVKVWGVDLSSGVRWQEAWIETTRCIGEKNIEVRHMQSGNWETIEAAFTSPDAQ